MYDNYRVMVGCCDTSLEKFKGSGFKENLFQRCGVQLYDQFGGYKCGAVELNCATKRCMLLSNHKLQPPFKLHLLRVSASSQ